MQLYYIVQSFLIYGIILFVLYRGSKTTSIATKSKYLILSLLLYSIIFGMRYGVGVDCNNYIESYHEALSNFYSEKTEIGYNFLMQIFASINAPTWCFMGTVAFIQIFTIYWGFRDKARAMPYISLTLMLGCVWLSYMNGMRQVLAFGLFVLSLYYAERHKYIIYYLLILLAISFHKSAFVLLIVYPLYLLNIRKILSLKIQYTLLAIALILGQISIIQDVMSYISQGAIKLGYDYYLNDNYSDKFEKIGGSNGVGYYIGLLIPVILIYYSSYFKDKGRMTFIYNLFFLGLLLKYAFISSPLIQRINYYFCGFDYLIGAFVLMYLHKGGKTNAYYFLLVLYILIFIGTLYRMFDNNSAFYFFWQSADYVAPK